MKTLWSLPLVELAILGFCAWSAGDLLTAWRTAPLDRLGWLALMLWLAPVGYLWLAGREPRGARPPLLAAALLLALVGHLADLNFAGHIALAAAVGSLISFSLRQGLWLLSACAWMPALGWVARGAGDALPWLRLTIALAGAVLMVSVSWRPLRTVHETP